MSTKPQRKEVERSKGFRFEEKKSSEVVKNHKPQGPLFSRITNDFRGINYFFENKFEKVNLLYRAS